MNLPLLSTLPAVNGEMSMTALDAVQVVHASNRDPRWLAHISGAQPTLFQHPDWATLMEDAYGFEARVALAIEGGEVIGGLPYSEVVDFRGRRRTAGAFADVCEPLGDVRVWQAIEKALCADGVPWQIRSRVCPTDLSDETRHVGVHQVVSIPATLDEAFQRCNGQKRSKIRFAERAGVAVKRIDGEDGINVFCRLHLHTRAAKHKLLPQPRRFFDLLARRFFPEHGFVLVAEREESVLAVVLAIGCGDTLFAKFIASDLGALEYRPNDFLIWKCIESASELGFQYLDLGISETENLARFKRDYGALEAPVYVGRYNSVAKTAQVQAVERALSEVTAALTQPEVPVSAIQAGGDALYRFFV